jgi:ankyrin repeat protein
MTSPRIIVIMAVLLGGCQRHKPEYDLINAAARGDAPRITNLVSSGVNVNCTDTTLARWTPLLWAVYENQADAAAALLAAGADANYIDTVGHSALEMAKDPGIIKGLIVAGADITKVENYFKSLPESDPGRKAFDEAVKVIEQRRH